MADHPTRDDIDLLEGGFYVDDPRREVRVDARERARVLRRTRTTSGASRRTPRCSRASKDPTTFSNAGGIRPDNGPIPMMIDMDDPEHWKRRKLVNRGFTPGRVRDSEQKIRDVADAIIDKVCEQGECDFVRDIAAPLPMILIGDMLGVAPEDRDDLLRWSDDMVSAQSGSATDEQYVAGDERDDGVHRRSARTPSRERQAEPDRRPHERARARRGRRRPARRPTRCCTSRCSSSSAATRRRATSSAAAWSNCSLHPEQRKLLVDDPAKIPVAVEEMLRWVSPIKNMCRTVTHDTEFMGQPLRAGPEVHAAVRVGEPRRDQVRRPVPLRRRAPTRTSTSRSGSARTSASARRSPGSSCKVMFEQLLTRLPDLELAADPAHAPPPPRQLHQRPRVDAGPLHPVEAADRSLMLSDQREIVARVLGRPVPRATGSGWRRTSAPTASTPTCRRRPTTSHAAPQQIVARLRIGLEPLASIGARRADGRGRRRHRRHRARRALGVADRREGRVAVRLDAGAARRQVIVRWWDYWDLATLMGAAPAWWVEHIMREARRRDS